MSYRGVLNEKQLTMRFNYLFAAVVILTVSCTSGKKAYQHGNYYQAVMEAVDRLRSSPGNRKAEEVLKLSYPMAVEALDREVQNAKAAGAADQWRVAVRNYNLINTLYDEIRRSPAALSVIPEPQQRLRELADSKGLAAEEVYQAGLASMLKGTREDSKRAFNQFTEALNLVPEYKEASELANQAREDATIHVVVEPVLVNRAGWNMESAVFGYKGNPFVKFYSLPQADELGLKRRDHFISMAVNNYAQSFPSVTRTVREFTDSVKTGERKVGNKVEAVMTKVKAKATIFDKTVQASGSMKLVITEAASSGQIGNFDIISTQQWTDQWIIFTGDARALPPELRRISGKTELFPAESMLRNMVRQDLERKLSSRIASFYGSY